MFVNMRKDPHIWFVLIALCFLVFVATGCKKARLRAQLKDIRYWMHKMKNPFVPFLVLVLASCSANPRMVTSVKPSLSSPSEEITLVGQDVDMDPNFSDGGYLLRVINDTCAIIRYFGQPYLLATVSLTKKEAFPLMYVGRGPGEMIDAAFASGEYLSNGKRLIDVFDTNESLLKTLDIDQSEQMGAGFIFDTREIPRNSWVVFSSLDMIAAKVVLDDFGCSYQIFDPKGNRQKVFQLWKKEDTDQLFEYMASADCINPNGSKIALCFTNLDKIIILDLVGKESEAIVTKSEWLKKSDLDEMRRQSMLKEDVSYYLYSCCDRSNVYALHYPGNEIQVFNWEGDYIKKINIDRNLICISISPSGILYGTDMDGQIVRYELN